MNSKVNWGAILAGAFIALASNTFFSRLALAGGIHSVNLAQPVAMDVPFLGGLFTVLAASISFALGGYCTVRLAGLGNAGGACLHALTSFSVSGVIAHLMIWRAGPSSAAYLPGSVAWTLLFAFGLASMAAAAGGVWGSKAHRKIDTRTYSSKIDAAEGEERWPAA
jgi:hypothetical protein